MPDVWTQIPEGLRLILIVMSLLTGGVFVYRKGANNMAALGVEATKIERESNEQDRLSGLEKQVGLLVSEVHALRAEMIGLQVSFANILLCDACRKKNEALIEHINSRLARFNLNCPQDDENTGHA